MMKTSQCTEQKRVALFPGSFDPFTRGHESIVQRALSVFDQIIVAIMDNSEKRCLFSAAERKEVIESTFRDEPRVTVVVFSGLTATLAAEVGATCILRGVRMVKDFEYELNIAEVNRELSGLETVLLYTLPQYGYISSTIVREMVKYGQKISHLLPEGLEPALVEKMKRKGVKTGGAE